MDRDWIDLACTDDANEREVQEFIQFELRNAHNSGKNSKV